MKGLRSSRPPIGTGICQKCDSGAVFTHKHVIIEFPFQTQDMRFVLNEFIDIVPDFLGMFLYESQSIDGWNGRRGECGCYDALLEKSL